MSKAEANKAIVIRWFTECWGKDVNLAVVDEIAAPDMLLGSQVPEGIVPASATRRVAVRA